LLHCKRGPRKSIIWLTKWHICFKIVQWCFSWGVFVTQEIEKRICHFGRKMWQIWQAWQDNFEAYLIFSESNHTLPRAPFSV
jgi:hypothetical protein